MRKILVIMLSLALCVGLCACGMFKSNNTPETILPSTDMNIIPDTMPTMGTNIPDPDVDTQMPIYTQGTDATEFNTHGND